MYFAIGAAYPLNVLKHDRSFRRGQLEYFLNYLRNVVADKCLLGNVQKQKIVGVIRRAIIGRLREAERRSD
jgi:hypothetical protein